jgi:cytochrome oxidase Cu insertion factor (SCO1/SenC/PrrC family)/thiol-disulfide isomerase/thioredoxin
MPRRLIMVAILAGFAVLAISLAIRAQLGSGTAAEARRAELPVGVAVDRMPPPVRLLGADGAPASLSGFHGRWLALAPTLTHCREVCPITTGALLQLRELMRREGVGERFAVAEVSVDPWRDSPAQLRAYRLRTGVRLPIYTGSARQLRRLWSFFGVGFRRVEGDVAHTDGVFLIDPSGRERVAIVGMPGTGGRLRPALRSLLDAEGRKNLAHPEAPWTARSVAADLRRLMGLRGPTPTRPAPSRRVEAATRLLDGSLEDRLRSLRGRPVVLNAGAPWCRPGGKELPLFAAAAARFGDRVAFLGADVEDDAANARRLLGEVPLGYPSYSTSLDALGDLAPAIGTPFTVFLDRGGRVISRHIGAYRSQSELDAHIAGLLSR